MQQADDQAADLEQPDKAVPGTLSTAGTGAEEELNFSRRERLAFIDFNLMFKGVVRRDMLIERFGIAPSVATKDFSRYKELAPYNIEYDKNRRLHLKRATFRPLFSYDLPRALASLCDGFGDGFVGRIDSAISCECPYHLQRPSLELTSRISVAICRKQAVSIDYLSLASGRSSREIVPHTLIDGGLRWYVRAFDRKSGQFRDFLLNRILSVQTLSNPVEERERRGADLWWNRKVLVDLIPHPALAHKEAVELEYGMQDGHRLIDIRAAYLGYLLQFWQVDCSEHYDAAGPHYLALANREILSYVSPFYRDFLG